MVVNRSSGLWMLISHLWNSYLTRFSQGKPIAVTGKVIDDHTASYEQELMGSKQV